MERTASTRAGRILRRAFVLALFAFGWLLCGSASASASTGSADAERPVVDLPGLVATVDHTLHHTLRSLARTVEDTPRTVHRAIKTASPAVAVAASPEAEHGATPRVVERPARPAQKTTRHGGRKHRAHTAARRAVAPAATRPVHRSAGRTAAPHAKIRHTKIQHSTIRLVHHQERGPAPTAPAAPESLTVGSAAQSSGAAGPAVPLLPGAESRRAPAFARDEARHTAPEPAAAPRGLPDCTPD